LQKRCSKLAEILNCIFKFNFISKTVAVKYEVKSNWDKGMLLGSSKFFSPKNSPFIKRIKC
jgi:hypothetical protein